MKKKGIIIISTISVISLCAVLSISEAKHITVSAGANEMSAPTQKYSTNPSTYYLNSNLEGTTGQNLLQALATQLQSNHKYYTSYDDIRGANAYSDEDPNDSTQVIAFYAGVGVSNQWNSGKLWNREHVWCQSLSNGLYGTTRGAGSDIHQLKPSIQSLNSTRNNRAYAEVQNLTNIQIKELEYNGAKTGNYYTVNDTVQTASYLNGNNGRFEPRDAIKGDVARILMYVYTHYSTAISVNSSFDKAGDLRINEIVYTPTNTAQASWNLVLKWNELDPVDEFEAKRNNYCASITGVRNPYIDHPEFGRMAFDPTYSGNGALLDTEEDKIPVTFYTNDGTNTVFKTTAIEQGSKVEEPSSTPSRTGYQFIGWSTSSTVKSLYDFNSSVNNDLSLYAFWKEYPKGSYTICSQISDLEIGSQYIITTSDLSKALSTTKKNDKFTGVDLPSGASQSKVEYITDDVQLFTLEQGSTSNSYSLKCLNTNSGYLTLRSATSELVLSSEKNANSSFTVSFSNNVATITSVAFNTHKIQFNTGYNYFSCYSNSYSQVAIYRLDVEHVYGFSYKVKANIDFDCFFVDNNPISVSNTKLVLTFNPSFIKDEMVMNNLPTFSVTINNQQKEIINNQVVIDITDIDTIYEICMSASYKNKTYEGTTKETSFRQIVQSNLENESLDTYTKKALEYINSKD